MGSILVRGLSLSACYILVGIEIKKMHRELQNAQTRKQAILE